MEYSEYASILNASLSGDAALSSFISSSPSADLRSMKLSFSSDHYKFLLSSSKVFIIILGNFLTQGTQLILTHTSVSCFKVLKDLKDFKARHTTQKYIGLGHSAGGSILAALSDIFKDIEAYCFNPIGLGRSTSEEKFYETFRIPPTLPNVTILKTSTDSLSKNYHWASEAQVIESKPGLHPHSIQNFIRNYEVNLVEIGTVFPSISQITFSPSTGFLLLESHQELSNYYIEGDVATVFYMVYTHPEEFYFTLLPADKNNLSGPYMRQVYGPEELAGTLVGNYMWEADWKLKQMDLGLWFDDETGQTMPITAEIPWFKSGFDFYSEEDQKRSFARLWFVNEAAEFEYANSSEGICIRPKKVKLRVEARKMVADSNSENGLVDSHEEHTSFKFAKYVTEHLDELAEFIPEIQRLKQLAVLVGLAKFFRDTLKVPKELLKLDLLKCRIPRVTPLYEVDKVPRLSRRSERVEGECVVILNLVGGVSMISQETISVYSENLLSFLNRSVEFLTPFQITHYDYMRDLLIYSDTSTDEETSTVYALNLFEAQSCSEDYCNNLVSFSCDTLDTISDAIYDEISPYSFEGKVYCKQHHPFRCCRKACNEVIMPGQAYGELEYGKFHSECIVCEVCGKGVVSQFVYEDGFRHIKCNRKEDVSRVEEKKELMPRDEEIKKRVEAYLKDTERGERNEEIKEKGDKPNRGVLTAKKQGKAKRNKNN